MTSDNWSRIKEIVDEAIHRKPEERPAYLSEACGDNDSIRREVESLLSSLESADGFMEAPAFEAVTEEIHTLDRGQVLGHYEILHRLGEGGMGIVYLGRDTKLDRLVAIKVLNNRYERNEDNVHRFVREAKAASALNHPNILTIFEIGEFDGSHFIVSEYIEGRTLRELLKSEKIELRTIVDIVVQIAGALAAAHKARIVHRDIKPENIIIRDDGYVKVVDFGLAKLLPENISGISAIELTAKQNATASGMILGTVNYMSPEQAKGKNVDERTDIFSLGVVLYEMLTGKQPFTADSMPETFVRLIEHDPAPIGTYASGVPNELQQVVSQMLEKDPENRYQSIREAADVLKMMNSGSLQPLLEDTRRESLAGLIPRSTNNSIAVLPFTNMSSDTENEYFCDGLTEEILNALAKVGDLKVSARGSAFSFKNKNVAPHEIGRILKVKTLLEGSVRRAGNRLRITVQLVNVADGYHLWSERYDREMRDIFDVQDEITLAVVDSLKVKLLSGERAALLKRYTDDTEAYELYLKGLHHCNKWTDEGVRKSKEYFEKALEKDPEFAPAYAKIADYYHFSSHIGLFSPQEIFPQWKEAAQRALEIDEGLADAHLAMAHIYFYYERDWAKAAREYARAVELSPNSTEAHKYYGLFLASRERFDQAVAEGKKALALDPLSIAVNIVGGFIYLFVDRLDDALAVVRQMIELSPHAPQGYWVDGSLLMANGKYEEAIEAFQKSLSLGDNQMALAKLGCAYGLAGRRDEALQILDRLFEMRERQYAAPFNVARIYAGLGDNDGAFEWMDKALEERDADVVFLKRYVEAGAGVYFGENFSTDSRYEDILRRAGLPAHEIVAGQPTQDRAQAQTAMLPSAISTQKSLLSPAISAEYIVGKISSNKLAAAVGSVFLLALISLGYWYFFNRPVAKQIESIAVMPFVNETGDPQVEYLSDGMTDTLISSLSELPNLKVKARTSVFRYKGKEIDAKAIGRELGVQAIVNGRLAQRDGRTRVTLEVVDTQTEDVIFSTMYNKPQSELVTLQSDIARDVSGKLKTKLSGAEEAKVTKTYTADPEALQLYLQGQFYRYKGGRGNVLRATDYFNKAIEKDPNYALAYAGLALNYHSYDLYNLVPDWQKARAAAKRAIELDDSLAQAQLAAGHYSRAIELNPDYADAHIALCINLTMTKRFDEGIAECSKARELDPSSAVVTMRLGAAYFFARRPDEAIEVLARAHEMDPTLWVPLGYLGGAQTLKGQYTEAAVTFRKTIRISDGSPNAKSHLAYALARAGQSDEALKLVDELKRQGAQEHINSFHFAVPYIGLGDKDEAFFWLGKGVDEGSLGYQTLDVHPWFDDLRADPRFQALLERTRPK